MKIVILGWGSLIWDPRDLPHQEPWLDDGPKLPLEFSRISKDRRLTLVIDAVNGELCNTLYSYSPQILLADAARDLTRREGTNPKYIGYYDHRTQVSSIKEFGDQFDIKDTLSSWCDRKAVDGVVWTALPSNFDGRFHMAFSMEHAMTYLRSLAKNDLNKALEYFYKAPEQIDTPLRRRVKREWPEY